MKKYQIAVVLMLAFSITAMAADGAKLTASRAGNASASRSTAPVWGLPSVPSTILFYGGDINVNDPNAQGFLNGNNSVTGIEGQTYGAVTAPKKGKVTVTGVFTNNSSFFGTFDPPVGTYDVRTGVSEGNCGTDVASGEGPQTAVPTGRFPFGLEEFTTTVFFTKPLTATPGQTYWFNETPQCTNSGDSNCANGEMYYLSNTTQQTNGVNAGAQPPYQIYGGGNFGTCGNVCGSGGDTPACKWASWGLLK